MPAQTLNAIFVFGVQNFCILNPSNSWMSSSHRILLNQVNCMFQTTELKEYILF